ncbi:uncharacterized protein [Mobula birostris]|uniref:uncharacterized protein isoform X1 n=1 Tax=Mobula birostris TaxID=1983395 RepID=UPI003B27EB7B
MMMPFFFLLTGSVFTQEEPTSIYIGTREKHIVLNGSDIPVGGVGVWEWRPHRDNLSSKTLVKVKAEVDGWTAEWFREDPKTDVFPFHRINDSHHLTIKNVAFEAAGMFTFKQMEPEGKILKQYEIFITEVKRDPRYQYLGSDVTLSCIISRLPDTVSLQWTEKNSSQNRINNMDQIHLNNTVYLMVRDVKKQDKEQYACEVQEYGRTVLTVDIELHIVLSNYGKEYTNFWPIFGNNPLYLNCKGENRNQSTWYWKKYNHEKRRRVMSSDVKGRRETTLTPELWNRIKLQEFDGTSFPLQISPAEFEDAGTYICTMETVEFVKVELITTKMTAIPPHRLAEGDDVTLTCSISHTREATRLIWMETGRKSFVKEKTLNPREEGNISLSVFIQKVGPHNRKWTCLVFNRKVPRIFITIQLEVNEKTEVAYLKLILIPVVLALLCFIAVMITYHTRVHKPVEDVQREPIQRNPCATEIEYAAVTFQNRPVNENQRQPEDHQTISDSEPYQNEIRYAAIKFQERSDLILNEQSKLESPNTSQHVQMEMGHL